MSIKTEWKKIETWWKAWWHEAKKELGLALKGDEPAQTAADTDAQAEDGGLPNPSLASCWEGSNAQTRHMNELSPAFSDEQVTERLEWAKARGCNTVHWFLVNQGDGEGAGYSPYGGKPTLGKVDASSVARMTRRIALARTMGFAVVPWLLADDSNAWNGEVFKDPSQFVRDLEGAGLFADAPMVVAGLEMNEFNGDWNALVKALRSVYSGKVGTHHTAGHADYAKLGDVLLWQTHTGLIDKAIRKSVQSALVYGKPVIAFELERNPARGKAQAALDAGAVGVGNW